MLRNREILRFALLCLLVTAVTAAPACYLFVAAGIWVLLSDVCLAALFFTFTASRYRRIARISEQIDRVLHGEEHLIIDAAEEGELSILESEISKMVLRIREQNEALKGEKEHLADSLADIAHQLRTPLTSANLILTLAEKENEAAERKRLLREAESLFSQVNHLLDSLLKLSRLDAGIVDFRAEAVSVRELTASALRPLLIPMELHGICLVTEIPETAVITGDEDWLAEAVQNILKNCIQSVETAEQSGYAARIRCFILKLRYGTTDRDFPGRNCPICSTGFTAAETAEPEIRRAPGIRGAPSPRDTGSVSISAGRSSKGREAR